MSQRFRVVVRSALAVLILAAGLVAPLQAATDPTYAALRAAKPDGRKIPVQGLVLERDAFRFQLDSGALHQPVQVAGFNYGKFEKLERKDDVSGLQVEVFTGTDSPYLGPQAGKVTASRLADSAAVDGLNSARVFTAYFGALPQTHVAITQQAQWSFGQSWPSLIFLPYVAFLDGTQRNALGLTGAADFINQVGFHEFAHVADGPWSMPWGKSWHVTDRFLV